MVSASHTSRGRTVPPSTHTLIAHLHQSHTQEHTRLSTHRRAIMLPSVDGILPDSWLVSKYSSLYTARVVSHTVTPPHSPQRTGSLRTSTRSGSQCCPGGSLAYFCSTQTAQFCSGSAQHLHGDRLHVHARARCNCHNVHSHGAVTRTDGSGTAQACPVVVTGVAACGVVHPARPVVPAAAVGGDVQINECSSLDRCSRCHDTHSDKPPHHNMHRNGTNVVSQRQLCHLTASTGGERRVRAARTMRVVPACAPASNSSTACVDGGWHHTARSTPTPDTP